MHFLCLDRGDRCPIRTTQRRFTGAGSVRSVVEVGRFVWLYFLGLEVHAAGIDRRRARRRTWILQEDDLAAGLRLHFVLEMRIRHECKGARLVERVAEL